ncbi:MAG: molybdenum cofactor biosynthesis protein B [Parvularculaceae bacterium]|nr:molybdenum cofactor biosynthesis protein B [Parvularculaceae bacterium]
MAGIDPNLEFKPLQIAILTVSDTRTLETDTSGALLVERLDKSGHKLKARALVRDDISEIRSAIEAWIADPAVDAVITTGGTGLTGRDVTVEAVTPLFEKTLEGFSVVFHMVSHESVGLSTLQSRATAGVANGTVIFCLPGSTGAVRDGWDKVISHQLDCRYRPCNLVELMPRLKER